jgi:hypothetical protein
VGLEAEEEKGMRGGYLEVVIVWRNTDVEGGVPWVSKHALR